MRSGLNVAFLFMATLSLLGCEDRKIDASTAESMKSSVAAIRESLPEDKRVEFEESYKALVMSSVGSIFDAAANPDATLQKAKDKVDGKTAADIMAEGGLIVVEQKKRMAEQAVSEKAEVQQKISDLEQRRKDRDAAIVQIKKFEVLRSRLYVAENRFNDEVVIELTVKNGMSIAVSHVYFDGVLSSPGRSVPWVKSSLNYKIPGGIEPGEEATWSLSPNMFGDWSKAPRNKNDMVLTMTAVRLDGADGSPVFDIKEADSKASDQLEKLKARLIELDGIIGKPLM